MMISIVIPAHNEEENIAQVVEKVQYLVNCEHELVVVNDHSTDRTSEIVKGLCSKYHNLRLVDNEMDPCFANAIITGFSAARGDAVVPVMGDLCDELDTINKMSARICEGYDVVCGSRYIRPGKRIGGSKVKGALSCFAGWSLYYLLGIPTHDIANAFKMYRKNVLESIKPAAAGFDISMELPLKAYYAGFKITEVPTVWHERSKGVSNFKVLKVLPSYIRLYLWAISKRLTRKIR